MKEFLSGNTDTFNGIYFAYKRFADDSQYAYAKIMAAQTHYFDTASGAKYINQQDAIKTLLDEALHKYYWGCLSLKQFWGFHNHIKFNAKSLPELSSFPILSNQN